MLGLALSMGTSGVLLHRDSDRAVAAEPQVSEFALAAASQSSAPSFTHHTVREGQTLWMIAQEHTVDVYALASLNELQPDALLQVGMVLKVPVEGSQAGITQPVNPQRLEAERPPIDSGEARAALDQEARDGLQQFEQADAGLKLEQDQSLQQLQQKSQELDASLSQFQMNGTSVASAPSSSAVDSTKVAKAPTAAATSTKPEAGEAGEATVAYRQSEERLTSLQPLAVGSETSEVSELESVEETARVNPTAPSSAPAESTVRANEVEDVEDTETAVSSQSTLTTENAVTVPSLASPQPTVSVDQPLTMGLETTSNTEESMPSTLPQLEINQPMLPIPMPEIDQEASIHSDNSDRVAANPAIQSAPRSISPTLRDTISYEIQPGDTLSAIARSHGITRAELAAANGIGNQNVIWAGATLVIPQPTGAAVPATVPASDSVAIAPEPARTLLPNSDADNQTSLPSVVPTTDAEPSDAPSVLNSTAADRGAESDVVVETAALQPEAQSADAEPRFYAERLLEEMRQMRSQRQAQQATTADAGTAEPIMSETAVEEVTATDDTQVAAAPRLPRDTNVYTNPAAAEPAEDPVKTDFEQRSQPQEVPTARNDGDSEEAQLMAAAPVGSEQYAPLSRPAPGQMVSPELPTLPNAEEFLPDNFSNGHIWPAQGVLTSGYGWRWGRMHRGIDIAAPIGTPVLASASGVVVRSGWNSGGYGNLVEIRHADGTHTRYAHNNRLLVQVGDRVRQGQQIAEMGSTGYSTGPHVHFELHPPNQGAVNPMAYLPAR
jgi:murein DD-endopeptidase MepM/ murein hydrolase activator NlpD